MSTSLRPEAGTTSASSSTLGTTQQIDRSAVAVPQDAALRVVKGSLGISAATTVGGMVYGALKAQPAVLHGLGAGFYTFAYVFPMFAMREYVVNPLLDQYAFAQDRSGHRVPSMHTHNLASSTISSAVAGVAMRSYFRGRGNLFAGLLSFGLAGGGFQLAFNEVRVARIKLLSRHFDDDDDDDEGRSSKRGPFKNLREAFDNPLKKDWNHDLLGAIPDPTSAKPSTSEKQSPLATKGSLRESGASSSSSTDVVEPTGSRWIERAWRTLASYSPVKQISDEEYERALLQQRALKVEQIRRLDEQIAKEENEHRQV